MPVTLLAWALLLMLVASGCSGTPDPVLTFSGSALGAEGDIVRTQLARFAEAHPDLRVEIRSTPDSADQRHQLYVQWLNARAEEPDVLQLDVIWTPEFAAAGWIRPLDGFGPDLAAFFPATIEANRWQGRVYALPWFVDVGMLYWRTDLLEAPPQTFEDLVSFAGARPRGQVPFGFVWQGARYEGLVTVFVEHLGGFGGRILDDAGRVVVNSDAGVRALTWMRDAIHASGTVPAAVLTWQEEQTRFAFQNGQALLMRNWPYASALMAREESRVAGRFGVAPMPASGGRPSATLGGSQLAINARSREPEAAYALIEYLTAPEQMLERARVAGQYPARADLYDDGPLAEILPVPTARVRQIIGAAVARPVTPVYTQLSEVLQVWLHRALTGQESPRAALDAARREIDDVLARAGLAAAGQGAPQ